MHRILLLVVLGIIHMSCQTQDWPDWRGENRDGTWEASGIVETINSDVIELEWSVPIGPGYSGPTVAKGKVYVTDRIERPSQAERVLCFDEQTGEQIWAHQYACVYDNVGYPAGPRTSVILNEGKAYSLGTMGHLFCLDANTGRVLWQRELNTEYE
ncbi:MAG: PQQ-binding-like beta-propeller repeat protein, partial [Bacteroidota bacterium]|nr:PQQ-binding-like beta-propeller repeat protein [Bacteroidota bacterium]